MRIYIDVDPLDLAEVPRAGQGIPLVFSEGLWRTLIVWRTEALPDGRLRLEGDIAARLSDWH